MLSVAEFIAKHSGEILQCWFDEASRAASSRGLDRPEFTNIMPTYVSALAEAHSDLGDFPRDRRKHIESHLASRIRQGFLVEEIVDEILLVGRCVDRASDAECRPDQRAAPADRERLREELYRAAAAVSDMFMKHMVEDEQDEKRYGRLLRDIASDALQEGAEPFRARLNQALTLIMEGVGANSAALLLYRPASMDLVSVATVGIERMEEYVVGLAPSSFAGKVASHADATSVEDAATTQLAIPDGLRRSGIHSLVGVRLPAHRTLSGVLYVGLCEQRPFTAREVRRLEALGEQLTLHLDNASLVASLNQKVDALRVERELRERFVSVLAHDLRGPLSAVKMATSLLTMTPDGQLPTLDEQAKRIGRNIDRADRMVRDLLDANRIHAGERLPLQLAQCDLVAMARATIEELTELHGARFVLTGEEHTFGVWSEEELRRSLWNLATNAIKYGAAGRPITVRIDATGDRVLLSVHNEGVPIPEEEQERLFVPFARARATHAGGPRGWGLGLTLVRGTAEAHGGRATVKSDATGTAFSMDLPRDARPFQAQADDVTEAPSLTRRLQRDDEELGPLGRRWWSLD
ncbi:Sensory box histidine kinase/response regulator [Labilithrix luteola]|uniref:histidine kinase n=1 Tax=Labilithrix luteola TaxID=1391654 RepID=A0A0K1PTZ2_9BACT|nr:sensor histidine kinase [Labilithrix luteola]AKU96987.1 Sensory box histidine kinase/response regulator [Labilithrix luteola]